MFYFFLQENIQILRDLSLLQIQMRDLEGFRVSHKLYLAKRFAPCPLVVSKANTKKMGLCFCLVFFFLGQGFTSPHVGQGFTSPHVTEVYIFMNETLASLSGN